MMTHFIFNLLAILVVCSTVSTLARTHDNQYRLGSDTIPGHENPSYGDSRLRCDLSRPVDPSADGLLSSEELFSDPEELKTMIKRHQPLVRIPSICYDDLGDFDEDGRWKPLKPQSIPQARDVLTSNDLSRLIP